MTGETNCAHLMGPQSAMEEFELKLVGMDDFPIDKIASILCSSPVIQDDWSALARGMGISSAKIKSLRHDLTLDKISKSDLICDLVETWVTQTGRQASLASLIAVVEEKCKAFAVGEMLRNVELGEFNDVCPIELIAPILLEDPIIQDGWPTLALRLGIPIGRIIKFRQDLNMGTLSYSSLIHDMLELWRDHLGSQARLSFLIHIIDEEFKAKKVSKSLRKLRKSVSCQTLLSVKEKTVWDKRNEICLSVTLIIATVSFGTFLYLIISGSGGDVPLVAEIGEEEATRQLISGPPQPRQLGHLPQPVKFYINRTLISRREISADIFEHASPDVFLFTNMERHRLSALAKNRMTSTSREQLALREIKERFIILNMPSHFERICNKTSAPVHLLRYEGHHGKLKWVRSSGKMDFLQKYVDKSSRQEVAEDSFFGNLLQNDNQPICITGSPGVGKSIFLAQAGRRLKEMSRERRIIFLVASELVNMIRRNNSLDIKSTLRKELRLNFTDPLTEILLDGFDEVASTHSDLVHEILHILKTSFKSIRLWVTSRPHFQKGLENSLSVLCYELNPFTEAEQIVFLRSLGA